MKTDAVLYRLVPDRAHPDWSGWCLLGLNVELTRDFAKRIPEVAITELPPDSLQLADYAETYGLVLMGQDGMVVPSLLNYYSRFFDRYFEQWRRELEARAIHVVLKIDDYTPEAIFDKLRDPDIGLDCVHIPCGCCDTTIHAKEDIDRTQAYKQVVLALRMLGYGVEDVAGSSYTLAIISTPKPTPRWKLWRL